MRRAVLTLCALLAGPARPAVKMQIVRRDPWLVRWSVASLLMLLLAAPAVAGEWFITQPVRQVENFAQNTASSFFNQESDEGLSFFSPLFPDAVAGGARAGALQVSGFDFNSFEARGETDSRSLDLDEQAAATSTGRFNFNVAGSFYYQAIGVLDAEASSGAGANADAEVRVTLIGPGGGAIFSAAVSSAADVFTHVLDERGDLPGGDYQFSLSATSNAASGGASSETYFFMSFQVYATEPISHIFSDGFNLGVTDAWSNTVP